MNMFGDTTEVRIIELGDQGYAHAGGSQGGNDSLETRQGAISSILKRGKYEAPEAAR